MTEAQDPLELAARAMREQAWATPPNVSRLRSDVRSGENFLIVPNKDLPDFVIGAYVMEWGYEVPRDRSAEFHAFLAANEKQLAAECPSGVQYRGTYGVWAQSNSTLGAYRTIWAFSTISAMELMAAEVTAGSSFGKRLEALTAFREESIGASRSQQIYHPAATAQRT